MMSSQLSLHTRVLYRRCLKSAARCPSSGFAAQMKAYTRLKFAEGRRLKDPRDIAAGLARAEDELVDMEYMHGVRESKQAASAQDPSLPTPQRIVSRDTVRKEVASELREALERVQAVKRPRVSAEVANPDKASGSGALEVTVAARQPISSNFAQPGRKLAKFCPDCGHPFSTSARFCSECGARRPGT
jgi:hypothetical protein